MNTMTNLALAAYVDGKLPYLGSAGDSKLKWDLRFLDMAELVAGWSKDPSTQCGAVIVRPDRTVASVGFNGFPKGCLDDQELYDDRETKYSRVVHAEANAILFSAEPVNGYTMYTYPASISPTCDRCATLVIQSGITRIVHEYSEGSAFSARWAAACESALNMYTEAGVEVVHMPKLAG